MTLREIAEHAKKCIDPLHRDITTTLLNAVVEERAKYLDAKAVINEEEFLVVNDIDENWKLLSDEDKAVKRTQALEELNLEGVWPIGGKND